MSQYYRTLGAVLALNAAAISSWLVSEVFFHPQAILEIVAAVALNIGIILLIAALVYRVAGVKWATHGWRMSMLFVLVFVILRFTGWFAGDKGSGPLLSRPLLAAMLATAGIVFIQESLWPRFTRTVIAGSIAFILTPLAWTSLFAPNFDWPRAAKSVVNYSEPSLERSAVLALLLDELSDSAIEPIIEALHSEGLQVDHRSLTPAGANTFNVLPAMFTGYDFTQAKACGFSSICSGIHVLNMSKVHVKRSDIDVVGLLLPYCNIQGLRSCVTMQLPSDYPTAFHRLANVYLTRFSKPLPTRVLQSTEGRELGWTLVQQQIHAIDTAPFWVQGGILYAHLALPHPPGSGPANSLDSDYQANLSAATKYTRNLARRLRAEFGESFSLIIFSDHPLRQWCETEFYTQENCTARETYQSRQVPLILAGMRPQTLPAIDNNIDIFRIF